MKRRITMNGPGQEQLRISAADRYISAVNNTPYHVDVFKSVGPLSLGDAEFSYPAFSALSYPLDIAGGEVVYTLVWSGATTPHYLDVFVGGEQAPLNTTFSGREDHRLTDILNILHFQREDTMMILDTAAGIHHAMVSSVGTHGNGWNGEVATAGTRSGTLEKHGRYWVSIFGNTSVACDLSVWVSFNNIDWFRMTSFPLAAGNFHTNFSTAAPFVHCRPSVTTTITLTIAAAL